MTQKFKQTPKLGKQFITKKGKTLHVIVNYNKYLRIGECATEEFANLTKDCKSGTCTGGYEMTDKNTFFKREGAKGLGSSKVVKYVRAK